MQPSMPSPQKECLLVDIDKHLQITHEDQSSPTTTIDPTTQNPATDVKFANNNDNRNVAETRTSHTVKVLAKNRNTTFTTSTITTIVCIILAILMILLSPFALVYVIGSICITGNIKDPRTCFSKREDDGPNKGSPELAKHKGIYMKMLHFEPTKQKLLRMNLATITRAGCLALLWLVVNLCVSSLKTIMLFHYPLWKWTLLVVVILLGYPVTTLIVLILLLAIYIFFNEISKEPNLLYVLDGLENSLTSLLHFVGILIVWLCYFRTDQGLHPSERVDKFVTWTCVSLLVGAVLWVLKRVTLLKWQANAVHKRFKARILTAGFQLYFLTLIDTGETCLELLPWKKVYNRKKAKGSTSQPPTSNLSDGGVKDRTNLRIQDFMLSIPLSVYQIDEVAQRVTNLRQVMERENDGIPDIVAKIREKIPTRDNRATFITEKVLKENFRLNEEDAQLLLQELKGLQMSEEITYDAFQKWMVDAHKNCLSVGYTLFDAFEVVNVLNRVMIGFIFVVVVLVWLLITGLATTNVLVLIASPFLALSFVFGDTCKTFFQGIIFSFVTHPYDVGDRCIIEGNELEVKRIGILTTTFIRIGTKEKMIYPNATLATTLITNLEGEPDPSDTIELILDSSTTKLKILGLKKDLESFFESPDREGCYEKNVRVAVQEIGSGIRVSISFTHVMNVQDVSHSQCVKKKNKQRSELLIDIKEFLENQEIKLADS